MTHQVRIDAFGHVIIDDQLICLPTRRELAFLTAILSSTFVVTRENLLSVVYGGRDEPDSKIFDVFAAKLRVKLGEHRKLIETVWGRGYVRNPDYIFDGSEIGATLVPIPLPLIEDLCLLHPNLDLPAIVAKVLKSHIRNAIEGAAHAAQ